MADQPTKKTKHQGRDLYTVCLAIIFVALLAGIAIKFPPANKLCRQFWYGGEAECLADRIKEITRQVDPLDESTVLAFIENNGGDLKSRIVPIETISNELMWFRANEMYTVGLGNTGRILWMEDGVRIGER